MADDASQNYKNHAKIVPLFHYFVLPVMLVNLIWAGWRVAQAPGVETGIALLVAMALAVLSILARVFALKVQDRVIRLEMRLRMRELLPADMHPRIDDFTIEQLVALRFASDAELPELAATVLHDNLDDRKTIKQMVKQWRPDLARM